jgi:CheY-like chemotaxis protein
MSQESILIVEDEAIVALALTAVLRDLGYTVLGSCVSGEKAVELAEQRRPQVVLMDINLRGAIDGIEAAERITAAFKTQMIFVTGQSDHATRKRADTVGHAGYLVKPYTPGQLEAALKLALTR